MMPADAQPGPPARPVAYIHGARHDLWWEFRLIDCFRWQAHIFGLTPPDYAGLLNGLVRDLGLGGLRGCRVEELHPAERARADLAVALLSRPALLIWAEPFALLPPADRSRVARAIQNRCQDGGLRVLVVGPVPPELRALDAPGVAEAPPRAPDQFGAFPGDLRPRGSVRGGPRT